MSSNPDSRQNVPGDAAPGAETSRAFPSLATRSSAGIGDEAVLAATGRTRPGRHAVLNGGCRRPGHRAPAWLG